MKTSTVSLFTAIGLIVVGATVAHAGNRAEKMFDRVDQDSNGQISMQEAEAFRDARFKRLDADGNGSLTPEEMQHGRKRHKPERMAKRFEKMDANGNGSIERTEFEERGARRFGRMDANGDGVIVMDEVLAMRKKHRD